MRGNSLDGGANGDAVKMCLHTVIGLATLAVSWAGASEPLRTPTTWAQLPPIPDREGFAGAFVGVSGGALLLAGGSNFPDKRPWEGGVKVCYDRVFVLEEPGGIWQSNFTLPRPTAYGISITTDAGVVCIGGGDTRRYYTDVFLLSYAHGKLTTIPLPSLPEPLANGCGALLDSVLYVAGGTASPAATQALKTFWRLDLGQRNPQWQALPSWPGRGRMLATAGVQVGAFYLFGGAALVAGADGKPVREWLHDAYRYVPAQGWQRIADLPRAVVAAPSPTPLVQGALWVLGGDDGLQINLPPAQHKGFPHEVLAYDAQTDTWKTAGRMPVAHVTTPAVNWRGRWVIANGEVRPGVRSPEVWTFQPDLTP